MLSNVIFHIEMIKRFFVFLLYIRKEYSHSYYDDNVDIDPNWYNKSNIPATEPT